MNHQIQPFDFHDNEVRVLTDNNGEPWFVGKDVCDVLGYLNASKALADHVDDEDKLNNESLSSLGQRGGWLINESGLYSLILSSQLPSAKEFKRWVTSEVLPAIRRDGAYVASTGEEDDVTIMARGLLAAQRAIERKDRQLLDAQAKIDAQRDRLTQTEPLAMTAQALCDTTGSMTFTDAARHFMQLDPRMNRTRVIATLRAHGYLERNSLAPTRKATDSGYLKPIIGKRHDGRLGRQYSHFTTKGMGWFINRFIYGNAQGTLNGTGTED